VFKKHVISIALANRRADELAIAVKVVAPTVRIADGKRDLPWRERAKCLARATCALVGKAASVRSSALARAKGRKRGDKSRHDYQRREKSQGLVTAQRDLVFGDRIGMS